MGKHKSKKHHKRSGETEERSRGSESTEMPIKLVLKMGGSQETIVSHERKGRHNKTSKTPGGTKPKSKEHRKDKKKKKEKDKERKKLKLDTSRSASACPSPAVSSSSHDRSKRKRDRHEVDMDGDAAAMDAERPIKKIHIKPLEPPPPRDTPTPKSKAAKKKHKDPTPLQLCLENLHCTLQRKDIQGFFAYPVNDAIAPGYSRVIVHPMDFSTIKTKIESNVYTTIEAFRDDFSLMCNNAMVYNAPETIYYKAAKRILQIGTKMMTLDRIRNMYRSIGYPVPADDGIGGLSDEPIDVDTVDSEVCMIMQSAKRKSRSRTDASRTSAAGRKILAQVQEASKRVSAQLKQKYPKSKIGFLRRANDGTTSLAVLNPDSSKESLPVNLGTTAGKVPTGSHITAGFKEDKRNKATPVSYLMYGPFGSFAPTYDSSRATITKGQSDLLYSTYGNDVGIQYAQSIQEFVKNTSTFAHGVVDRLLNVLTEGAHSKCIAQTQEKSKPEVKVEEKKDQEDTQTKTQTDDAEKTKKPDADAAKENSNETKENGGNQAKKAGGDEKTSSGTSPSSTAADIDLTSLMSLSDLGIDVSFLAASNGSSERSDGTSTPHSSSTVQTKAIEVDAKLNSGRRLLEDLQEAQNSRLSLRPGDALSATPEVATKPSDKELSLAEQLTDTLKELTSKVRPGDVTEVQSLRAAMGVGPVLLTTKNEGATADKPLVSKKGSDTAMEQDGTRPKSADQSESMDITQAKTS